MVLKHTNHNEENGKGLYGVPCLVMLVSSVVLFFLEAVALVNYGTAFDTKLLVVVATISGIHVAIAVVYFKQSGLCSTSGTQLLGMLIVYILALCYMIYAVWGWGYLSLNPIKHFCDGTMRSDTLTHSAFAGSIATYGYPTTLINDLSTVHYHLFSHYIMGIGSRALGIPTIFIYCFIYPILFIPFFSFLILAVSSKAKAIVSKKNGINIYDMIVVCASVMGIVPIEVHSAFGGGKISNILSESYFIGNTVLLLYFLIIMNLDLGKIEIRRVTLLILNPIFIFVLFYSKSSLGILFTVGIILYLLRNHYAEIKYYFVYLFYGGVFLFSVYIGNPRGAKEFEVKPFTYLEKWVLGGSASWALFLVVNFSSVIFLAITKYIEEGCNLKKLLFDKKNIFIQLLAVISVISIIPGMFLDIVGGSAGYFFLSIPFFAACLIVGNDIPYKISMIKEWKYVYYFIIGIILLVFINNANMGNVYSFYKEDVLERNESAMEIEGFNIERLKEPLSSGNLYKNMESIYTTSRKNREKCAVLVEDDISAYSRYNKEDSGNLGRMFFYPGILNMLCLNLVLSDDTCYYDRNGREIIFIDDSFAWNIDIKREKLKTIPEVIEDLPCDINKLYVIKNGAYYIEELN